MSLEKEHSSQRSDLPVIKTNVALRQTLCPPVGRVCPSLCLSVVMSLFLSVCMFVCRYHFRLWVSVRFHVCNFRRRLSVIRYTVCVSSIGMYIIPSVSHVCFFCPSPRVYLFFCLHICLCSCLHICVSIRSTEYFSSFSQL